MVEPESEAVDSEPEPEPVSELNTEDSEPNDAVEKYIESLRKGFAEERSDQDTPDDEEEIEAETAG